MRHQSLPPTLEGEHEQPPMDDLNDLTMSSDTEAVPTCKPPPRIAARFNRATKKKSASSSRRNSMSSLHSGRSSRSGQSMSHGTHIAQHLRRVSIIESRRAKIADRNAHAEQVRLRAQQAKAAPRTNRPSPEERALAAQQARERHLAQVAASGADEVKRAKKIAEETREKKAADQARATEEMEKRHADAEKRRLQYQQNLRRGRGHSLAVVEEKKVQVAPWKPKSEVSAARVIQNAWRNVQCRRAIATFHELNLDLEHTQTTSFDDMTSLLSKEVVLDSTARILKLCGLLDIETDAIGNVAVKTFLSAYLILSHPKQVFAQSGEQEEDLIGKAKVLLMQFQRVLAKPAVRKTFLQSSDAIISLSEAYSSFQTAFQAWKNSDSSILVDTMIAQFVELDAIWQSIKDSSPEHTAEDYKEGIRSNQAMLLARLKRLTGTQKAFKMISDAIKARRRQTRSKKLGGEIKPRAASMASEGPVSASATPSTVPILPVGSRDDRSLQRNELNKVISPLPDNRIVVHELAINKNFKIEVDTLSEDRRATNRAVFDLMRADADAGMADGWTVSMAETIRERLLRLVTPGNSMHNLISEVLDVKTIETQLRTGAFSYAKFFSLMNTILPKLCAPVRDTEVKALAADTESDYIERLAKLMHIIDLLGLDHANYLLHMAAPDLIQRASKYEEQTFRDELAKTTANLPRTHRWWRLARAHASADLSRRSPDGTPPQNLTSPRIYVTGLIDLFISLPPVQAPDVPETLELDRSRIENTRQDILRIITIGSILLTAKNLLKRDVRSQWRTQSQRMWDLAPHAALNDTATYLSIIESAQNLPPAVRNSLTGTIERILTDARSSPNISHPVMKVLLQKIKAHALARLGASSNEEKVRSVSTASEVLSAGGLPEFVGRIGAVVEEMGKVRIVDWEAHTKWIDDVATRVEADQGRP